jgi:predicted dehydrogenase
LPVRIGFIGTGGIAGAHFDTLSQIPTHNSWHFATSRPNGPRPQRAASKGKAYTDPRKMLEAETLDAVYVCLPPHAHKNAEILVAQKGCALFVEKPLANSMRTAEKIAAAVQDAKFSLCVGYHFRYFDATERLRRMLNVKGTPEVAMTNGYWLGGFPGVSWWRRLDQSGGQLVEQCTHIVDLARYLVGDIRRVYCRAAHAPCTTCMKTPRCPMSRRSLSSTRMALSGNFQTAALLGSIGQTGLDLMAHNTLYELRGNTLTVRGQGSETHTYGHGNNAYLEEDHAFIKAVKTGSARASRAPMPMR